MGDATRRGFLALAGTTAAAGVAVAAAPGATAAARENTNLPKGAEGSMAAYIHDLAKGEVLILVNGHEVVVTDKALTSKLAHAFSKAARS